MIHKALCNLVTLLGTATLALAPAFSHAQAFPTKPVTIIIPFAAGGPTDLVGRQLAQAMGKTIGGTVIVENIAGAGGTVAGEKVAKASPDGYTLLLMHTGMSTAPALYRSMRFDPLKDFEYIGQVADVPMTLVGNKDFPPNNYGELITYLKANSNKVNLANAGLGAVSHLCGLLFMSAIKIDLQTIPYKGTAPAMTDLQGGQVQLLCDQTSQTTQLIQTNRVKAYGITTKARIPQLPDLKTLDEQGLKGFDLAIWHGFYAPKGTPKAVLDKLNASLQGAIKDPDFVASMNKIGVVPVSPARASPEGLRSHLDAEIKKWGPIIKAAGQYAD